MKKAINLRYAALLVMLWLFQGAMALAQDGGATSSSSNVSTTTTSVADTTPQTWYMNPWVWAAGAVVLLIILIAAFRGGNSNGRSQVSRTYTTTTEVKND